MGDILRMHVLQGGDNLPEDCDGLPFTEAPPHLDDLGQTQPLRKLHDNVDLPLGIDRIIELRDVWVLQPLHELDLPDQSLLALGICQLILVIDFNSD